MHKQFIKLLNWKNKKMWIIITFIFINILESVYIYYLVLLCKIGIWNCDIKVIRTKIQL